MKVSRDLQSYIEAEYQLRALESDRLMQRDILLSAHYPQYGDEGYRYINSAENTAITLIESDELYEQAKKRYKRKSELLNEALNILPPVELKAFNHVVRGVMSDMPTVELIRHGKRANKKLCSFIEERNEDVAEMHYMEHRRDLRRQIAEYKGIPITG